MVVDGGYLGHDGAGPHYQAGDAGRRRAARPPGGGEREPFLQRWLFSRRLVYILAALALLLGLGGGTWWLTSGRYTTVPAVGQLPAAAAEHTLRQAGFQVRTGASVIDDNVPRGDVITVSPSGRALPGSTVTLTLSQGPRMITVPPVPSTDSVSQAVAALRGAGLTVAPATKKVGVDSNPVVGTVAGTDPAAGTSVPENHPVTVEEVAGLNLPNWDHQNINDAQQWASQNQVTLQPTQVTSSEAPGTIVSQSPSPGTVLTPGQTVTLSVSNGPPQVPIPDVRGQNCQQAQQQLQQAGFNVQVQPGLFGNNVSGMNPTGQAPGGSTITLECGKVHF
jgi:serine/threonine-protein kinase